MKHRVLFFSSLLSGIAVLSANAATCIIDFGNASSAAYANAAPTATANAGLALNDLNGTSTGWSVSVNNRGNSTDALPGTVWDSDPALDNFFTSLGVSGTVAQSMWRTGISLGQNTGSANSTFTMTFSGLQAGGLYEISLASGRSSQTVMFNMDITAGTFDAGSWFDSGGATGTVTDENSIRMGSGINGGQRVTTITVYADASGVITLNRGNQGNNDIYYSTLEFATIKSLDVIPETSSATLGLLSLAGLSIRRKRS